VTQTGSIRERAAFPQSRVPTLVQILILAGALVLASLWFAPAWSSEGDSNPLAGIKFEMKAYFDYSNGRMGQPGGVEADFNRFHMTRGYFTFRKQANDWLSARITMDIHQDDTGDYKRRDKYIYAEIQPGDADFLTNLKSEIGIGHMPWLDFEEHINPYRCQGTMAIERAGTFNSADVGVSVRGYLGEKLVDAKAKTGNKKYAGRYGSWHVGVYNGGGYHAEEMNENKVLEGRLTVRPLPDILPGLQLSGLVLHGKGNVEATVEATKAAGSIPDYKVNLGMLSFEHPSVTLTGQVFTTEGNAKGQWVDSATGEALKTQGYSAFANVKIPGADGRLSLLGRFDHFDADSDDVIAEQTAYDLIIGGIAYDMHKGNLLMLVFESTDYEEHFVGKGKVPSDEAVNLGDEQKIQLVYQIKM
jgi:hypothetical protein